MKLLINDMMTGLRKRKKFQFITHLSGISHLQHDEDVCSGINM